MRSARATWIALGLVAAAFASVSAVIYWPRPEPALTDAEAVALMAPDSAAQARASADLEENMREAMALAAASAHADEAQAVQKERELLEGPEDRAAEVRDAAREGASKGAREAAAAADEVLVTPPAHGINTLKIRKSGS